MKKLLLCFLVIGTFTTFKTSAQSYTNAIGARLGFTQGITFRHFLHEEAAIEGILSTRWNGFLLTGLYEVHKQLSGELNWFYGGGAHIGYWSNPPARVRGDHIRDSYTVVGVDFILGLDFTFPDIPINLSLDWKPAINLINGNIIGDGPFWIDGGALSIRYAFD